MEEEKKVAEVEEVQPKEEVKAEEGMGEENKFSLSTFMLAVVGFVVCVAPVGSVAAIILGALTLKRLPNSKPTRQPFKTFDRVSKPVGIVDVILGAVSTLGWTIYFIVIIVTAIVAAVNGAVN